MYPPSTWTMTRPCSPGASWAVIPRRWLRSQCAATVICSWLACRRGLTMALRHFPGIGPGPNGSAGAEVLQLVGTPWRITKAEIYAGDAASMELFPSEDDPIGQLLP